MLFLLTLISLFSYVYFSGHELLLNCVCRSILGLKLFICLFVVIENCWRYAFIISLGWLHFWIANANFVVFFAFYHVYFDTTLCYICFFLKSFLYARWVIWLWIMKLYLPCSLLYKLLKTLLSVLVVSDAMQCKVGCAIHETCLIIYQFSLMCSKEWYKIFGVWLCINF